jgi:predicted lipid-binding transport protein (Tim44 family)
MAGNLEDFISSFTGGGANPHASEQFHDRFVSTDEKDREFDNQAYQQGAADYLEKLPDDQFQDAARNAVAQVPPEQRQDLLGGLLRSLSGGGSPLGGAGGHGGVAEMLGGLAAGGGLAGLAKMLGLGSTDPRQMSEDDAAKVMNYARKQNPEALRQTVQEKPWFLKAMGNPVVMGALTMAATRLLSNRRR